MNDEIILHIDEVDGSVAGYHVTTNKQTIELTIDNLQDCCEQWGYFWSNDDPQDFIGATLTGVRLTDTALAGIDYSEEKPTKVYEGGIMFVSLDTDRGTLQFVAYNEHNGYYGHEATVTFDTANSLGGVVKRYIYAHLLMKWTGSRKESKP